jgi:hypothetical protein
LCGWLHQRVARRVEIRPPQLHGGTLVGASGVGWVAWELAGGVRLALRHVPYRNGARVTGALRREGRVCGRRREAVRPVGHYGFGVCGPVAALNWGFRTHAEI